MSAPGCCKHDNIPGWCVLCDREQRPFVDFHDDKPDERADMAVSTQPGDLDHRMRTLKPGR